MSSLETESSVETEIKTLGHFIGGEAVAGGTRTADVYNPATGEVTRKVALADAETLETAVMAARKAYPAWRQTPPQKRAQILFRFKQLLELHAEEICTLITVEHGKVIDDAHGELGRGIEVVEYACGIS